MDDYRRIFDVIRLQERYARNLDWGRPRRGHPEGTVSAHILELEQNLTALRTQLSETEYWRLKILIHTHDTFKAEAARGVAIRDPRSHASLAVEFVREFCQDEDILAVLQFHDEPHALWQHRNARRGTDQPRFERLLASLQDWDLFVCFLIVDGCTKGKRRAPLKWFLSEIQGRVRTRFTLDDVPDEDYNA